MKPKPANKIIHLTVIVNSSHINLKFNIPIHTMLKELANMVAEKLKLDVFRANIRFQYGYTTVKLDETKTLAQSRITKDKETIYANIESLHTKPIKQFSFKQNQKLTSLDTVTFYPPSHDSFQVDGLTILSVCVNKKCVNFHRELTYPLGFGTFSLHYILDTIKCNICPYRDLNVNPSVIVKDLIFQNCKWTISGQKLARDKNGTFEECLNRWVIVNGVDIKSYSAIVNKAKWTQIYLEIKPNLRGTMTHPFNVHPDCLQDIHYSYF